MLKDRSALVRYRYHGVCIRECGSRHGVDERDSGENVETDWTSFIEGEAGDGCIGAIALDDGMRVRAVSAELLDHAGLTREEVLYENSLDFIHPDDLERAAFAINDVHQPGDLRQEGMYRLATGGGYRPFGIQAYRAEADDCLLYTSPSPRDRTRSRMPSSA